MRTFFFYTGDFREFLFYDFSYPIYCHPRSFRGLKKGFGMTFNFLITLIYIRFQCFVEFFSKRDDAMFVSFAYYFYFFRNVVYIGIV